MRYDVRCDDLATGVRRYVPVGGDAPLTYEATIDRWRTDAAFRRHLSRVLAEAPFEAYRWETPPVTAETADRPFAFVLIDSPELCVPPDPSPFAEPFAQCEGDVAVFDNLGGDARLVAPVPSGDEDDYAHLAAFARHAPEAQQDALWRCVGEAMAERLGARPVWLSTAGHGVAWLHVRLDDRPKYYAHRPYTSLP